MNNQKITALRSQLNELAAFRNATSNPALQQSFDAQIKAVKDELAALNPVQSLTASVESAVNDRVDEMTPSPIFEDMQPVVAIKCINGAAGSVMRHIVYRNRVHEAIMSRQAMAVAGTSGWKRTEHSTSPYDSEEDTLLAIADEMKSAITTLAQLLCDHEHTCARATRENVKLDVSGNEGHKAGYDEFPTMAYVLRSDEAGKQRRAVENAVRGEIVRAMAPNVIAASV